RRLPTRCRCYPSSCSPERRRADSRRTSSRYRCQGYSRIPHRTGSRSSRIRPLWPSREDRPPAPHPRRQEPPLSRGQGSSSSSLLNLQVAALGGGEPCHSPASPHPALENRSAASRLRTLPREREGLERTTCNGTIENPPPSELNMHAKLQ